MSDVTDRRKHPAPEGAECWMIAKEARAGGRVKVAQGDGDFQLNSRLEELAHTHLQGACMLIYIASEANLNITNQW